uniref:Phosphatidylinositol transfer protein n=1 Tax=Heterorhabditis bacteriophora TaxID=37862 RepID=A0A1I7WNC4_HETBA
MDGWKEFYVPAEDKRAIIKLRKAHADLILSVWEVTRRRYGMIVKEYRIPLPLGVEEFKRGQLYAVAECSKNETGGGEGAEVCSLVLLFIFILHHILIYLDSFVYRFLANYILPTFNIMFVIFPTLMSSFSMFKFLKHESFISNTLCPGRTVSGIYTHNIYRLRSKAPWALQKTLPAEAFEVHEESWNAYPYCKTIITNPGYMKNDFYIIIESMHLADNGRSENVLNAPKKREIMVLDICDDRLIGKTDYCAETDPKLFKSLKTSRGQLQPDWMNSTTPIMCCYKLVTIQFKWTGLGGMVERTVQKQYPKVFGKFHREMFCWLDNWIDLSMEEIRSIEVETALILRRQLEDPEKRGTTCCDNEKDQQTITHNM